MKDGSISMLINEIMEAWKYDNSQIKINQETSS